MTRSAAMAQSLGTTIEKTRTTMMMTHSIARLLSFSPRRSKSGLLLHPLLFESLALAFSLPGLSCGDRSGPDVLRPAAVYALVHFVYTAWADTLSLCFSRKSPFLLPIFCCRMCPRYFAPGRSPACCCSRRPEKWKRFRVCQKFCKLAYLRSRKAFAPSYLFIDWSKLIMITN